MKFKLLYVLLFFSIVKIAAQEKLEVFFDFDKYDINMGANQKLLDWVANSKNIDNMIRSKREIFLARKQKQFDDFNEFFSHFYSLKYNQKIFIKLLFQQKLALPAKTLGHQRVFLFRKSKP